MPSFFSPQRFRSDRWARVLRARRSVRIASLGLGLLVVAPSLVVADEPQPQASTSATLRSIFSFSAAPPRKTMGLLQRSFLEIIPQRDSDLEIALVIDGTGSMETAIAGVRESAVAMLEDLRRGRSGEVRTALVVFRDYAAPAGPVQILQDRFTADGESLGQALESLRAESGEPFFHELVDVGVHTALDRLPWSTGADTTRWVFLFGDAPPYAESFVPADFPEARRHYSTDLLVALAGRKGIQIHSVLCESSPELQATYRQALPETRSFMNALAAGTGGLMLDLSYPDIRQAIVEAGRQPRADLLEIEPITRSDLVLAREAFGKETAVASAEADPTAAEVRIAVLPHLPIHQMSFDAGKPAVQIATHLRHKLESLPRVRMSSPYDVERRVRRMRAAGLNDDQQVQAIANQLGVDYVVWGEGDAAGNPVLSVVYAKGTAEPLLRVPHEGEYTRLASFMLEKAPDDRLRGLVPPATGGDADQPSSRTQELVRPLARQPGTAREILFALETLEQVLGKLATDPTAGARLAEAQQAAEAALKTESTNGLAHWLLANIHFNLATAAQGRGETEVAEEAMREMKRSLGRAFRYRNEIDSSSLVKELVADHAFLVQRKVPEAIRAYESIANDPQVCTSVRRRAHWMLTGIYSGDWGVEPEVVDPSAARRHSIAILANWEASPEAVLLRKWLGWDEQTDRTEHPFLPRSHGDLANVEVPAEPAS
ncbi:MAG: VWA domain-containing protein [Planctomycetaceae bacterium]|nr:MAG: VWA domain-containing protein [Planctomycetaceae bacterium]